MQHFFFAFLIALTNNFDNIGARIAYSIRGIKISTVINLWISVITFVISFSAAFSGRIRSGTLGKQFSSIIAMVILAAIGSWMILEPYVRSWREKSLGANSQTVCDIMLNPENADVDNSKHIDFKEATLLGIALSLNNIGGGLSAGMLGLDSFLVGLLSAVLSFAALWAGNYVSEFFVRRHLAEKATVVAGLLLIALGIEQIL